MLFIWYNTTGEIDTGPWSNLELAIALPRRVLLQVGGFTVCSDITQPNMTTRPKAHYHAQIDPFAQAGVTRAEEVLI